MIPLLILGCVVLSFLLSGIETGVLLLNRGRVGHLKERGAVGAGILLDFMRDPGHLSATVLVGNTLVNCAAVVLAVHAGLRLGGVWTAIPWTLLFAWVLWFGCDLVPKALFRRFPNRLTTRLAPLLLAISIGLWPVVKLFEIFSKRLVRLLGGRVSSRQMFVTREELKLMAREGEQTLRLSGEQRSLVASILDSPNATAGKIMQPREKVASLQSNPSDEELLKLAADLPYSRLPLEAPSFQQTQRWEGLWVVYDHLFKTGQNLRHPPRVPLEMPLENILAELRKARSPMAFVKDLENHDVGIIAVEDVLRHYHSKIDL